MSRKAKTENKPCGLCVKPRVKGERYCPRHRVTMLRKMRDDGHFVDTNERTVFDYERMQNEYEHNIRQRSDVEDMMDRLDSYRDHTNESAALA